MGNGTVYGRIFADNATGDLKMGNPTSNDVMFYTANLERMRIGSNGDVAIGTSGETPSRFAVRLDANNDGNVFDWSNDIATFHIGGNGTQSQALGISGSTSSGEMYITTLAPSVAWKGLSFRANNFKFLYEGAPISTPFLQMNNNGISFDQGSNYLDDYEEGTWIPVISGGSGTKTMGTNNAGFYVKVGSSVTVNATVHVNGTETLSGMIKLEGLPFSVKNVNNYRSSAVIGANTLINTPTGYSVRIAPDKGVSFAWIIQASDDAAAYSHNPPISNSGHIYGISMTYFTD
jgi:hypothetical protein